MKNIFKKSGKKALKQVVQTLDKNQMGKVIGGADTTKLEIPIKAGISGSTN